MMNKVKIPNMEDRATMASILVVAGYVVWIEKVESDTGWYGECSKDYYVCWKEQESEVVLLRDINDCNLIKKAIREGIGEPRVIDGKCIYFRGLDECACNNEPDHYGECVYENGIEPKTPSAKCKYYEVMAVSE